MKKSRNGITLIALIVSIVVLLILAGIGVYSIFGQNGLLLKANSAKQNYSLSEAKESIYLQYSNYKVSIDNADHTTEDFYNFLLGNSTSTYIKNDKYFIEINKFLFSYSVLNRTLYLNYEDNLNSSIPIVNVTLDPNNGTLTANNKVTLKVGETYSNLPSPTRTEYIFLGWSLTPSQDGIVNSSTIVVNTVNHTLYAMWKKDISGSLLDKMVTPSTYGFTKNADGSLVSNNRGKDSTTANSYIPIDLTSYPANQSIMLRLYASISSEGNYDFGYATITNSTTVPAYSNATGRFICISGSVGATDYFYTLQGGSMYYLHLGYRKDGGGATGTDTFNIYNLAIGDLATIGDNNQLTPSGKYSFSKITDYIISTNASIPSSICSSYIKLDLSGYSSTLNFPVSANILSSCETDTNYAMISITTTPALPTFSKDTADLYITGASSAKLTKTIKGGSIYYLHISYFNNTLSTNYSNTIILRDLFIQKYISAFGLDINYNNNYAFNPSNGTIISTNTGADNTTANSYVKLDLTNYANKQMLLRVYASISSEGNYDIGYASVTNSTSAPAYSNATGRFIYISGSVGATDYFYNLTGGSVYYLHLGYRKDGGGASGTDTFNIYNIAISENTTLAGNAVVPSNYYSFIPANNSLVSTNNDKSNSICSSYIKLDLSGYSSKLSFPISMDINVLGDPSLDSGFAKITTSPSNPTFTPDQADLLVPGNNTSTLNKTIPGGSIYYLHIAFINNSSSKSRSMNVQNLNVQKYITFSNMPVYYNNKYSFLLSGSNKLISSNNGADSLTCNSYIPIDLTNRSGNVTLTVNASISSEGGYDIGYASVTNSTSAPACSTSAGRFIYISGSVGASNYTYTLQGGSIYYLHFGYSKDGGGSSGSDTFTINSINY